LKIDTVELAVAEHQDSGAVGNQSLHLGDQFDVNAFREVALSPLGHNPSNGQCPLFVDKAEHERHATAANNAAVHRKYQTSVAEAQTQSLCERKKERLALDRLVAEPSLKSSHTALDLCTLVSCPDGNLAGNGWKIRTLAAHNPADHGGQSVQAAGKVPSRFFGKKRLHRVTDRLESFYCRSYGAPHIVILA